MMAGNGHRKALLDISDINSTPLVDVRMVMVAG